MDASPDCPRTCRAAGALIGCIPMNDRFPRLSACRHAGMILVLFAAHAGLLAAKPSDPHLLGPTGIKGICSASEIQVSSVDKGSPAEGRIKVGEVIVGVAGKAFAAEARRELAEELNVQVVSAGAAELEVRDDGSSFLIAFVPVAIEGEPECREHTALQWRTPEELAALPLAPSDRQYVETVVARRASDR